MFCPIFINKQENKMNKITIRVIVAVVVILLFIPCLGFAQDKDEPNTVLCVKNEINQNTEGTRAEADSIYALLDNNVTKKNKYIKMEIRVAHFYGSKSGDFLTITEFSGSGLAIIEKAIEEDTRLYEEWMKDAEDRKAFNALFTKYFKGGHSDEIYTVFTKVVN